MGMRFAPTWLRQVSPPASDDHFDHCLETVLEQYSVPKNFPDKIIAYVLL